jgi:hypothetical protein
MEPVTAVGLIANILQFVELAAKLFRKARDIRDANSGEYSDIRVIAKELRAKVWIIISASMAPSQKFYKLKTSISKVSQSNAIKPRVSFWRQLSRWSPDKDRIFGHPFVKR